MPVRSAWWLPARVLLAAAVLAAAACGKHADNEAPGSAQEDAATLARDDAASTAQCKDHPLAAALPPKETIGGLPFRSWDCTPATIHAVYGRRDGRQVEISVVDTRPTDTGADDLNRRTRDMQRSMTRSAIELLTRMTDPMQANAGSFNSLGGPNYAPVLVHTATPSSFVVHVAAHSEVGPAEALALFGDRYVVTLQANDRGSALTGLTTPQAQALYLPYIQQFHPERLP